MKVTVEGAKMSAVLFHLAFAIVSGFAGGYLASASFYYDFDSLLADPELQGLRALVNDFSVKKWLLNLLPTVMVIILTYFCFRAVKYEFSVVVENKYKKRAYAIAVVLGVIATGGMASHDLLNILFGNIEPTALGQAILGIGSSTVGWVVWYLKKLEKHGDSMYVFLLVFSVGFCWYSLASESSQVQLSCFFFIVASLFRLLAMYDDRGAKSANK